MTIKTICSYMVILLLIFACKSKNRVCGLTVITMEYENRQKIPSTLKISEHFTIADTTVVNVSGKIYGETIYTSEKFQPEDILPFTNVVFKNAKTQQVFGETTNLEGLYSFTIPAATYQLKIQFIGFNTIVIDSLKLKTGEIFNLSAHLDRKSTRLNSSHRT